MAVSSEAAESIVIASLSDVGMVRARNEDSVGEFERDDQHLLVVADGMGGHKGGATASRIAVETIGDLFLTNTDREPVALLEHAILEANRRIYEMSASNPELMGMGTTVVALLLGPGATAHVAHVGDSRAYRSRGGELEALTSDHSVVAEMQRRGLLTADQAATHPRRNEILRSVGVDAAVEAEIAVLEMRAGDVYLLCSDGLSGLVAEEEILDVAKNEAPEEGVRILVNLANDLGGTDNVTVQIAAVHRVEAVAKIPSAADRTPTQVLEPSHGATRGFSAVAVGTGIGAVLLLLYYLLRG